MPEKKFILKLQEAYILELKKHASILFLFVLIVQAFALFGGTGLLAYEETLAAPIAKQVDSLTSDERRENSLVTNIIRNQGFEKNDSHGAPDDWSCWGSYYRLVNRTYTANVHGGLQSCYMEVKPTSQFGSDVSTSNWLSTYPDLTNSLTLDAYYYIDSNPGIGQNGHIYTYLYLSSPSGSKYLYYYLSYGSDISRTNQTNYAYFMLNSSLMTWNNLNRDIIADYQSVFGSASGVFVWAIYFRVNGQYGAETITSMTIDDVSIKDEGVTEYINNGNFESPSGSYWGGQSEGVAEVTPSPDCTEGSQSTNLTAWALGDDFSANVYVGQYFNWPAGIFARSAGTCVVEFDWKYTGTQNGGSQQQSYFSVSLQNNSIYHEIYYYLASETASLPSNNTYSTYMYANGFNTQNEWIHSTFDLFECIDQVRMYNMSIYNMNIYVYSGEYANSTVTQLVDDFKVLTYPTADPGFEEDWYWDSYTTITGWSPTGSGYPYRNQTRDAHTGNWAANLTAYGSTTTGLERYMFTPIDNSVFTDFWWKLDRIEGSGAAYSYIQLTFDNLYYLYYIIGAQQASFVNNSNSAFYLVQGFNTTDIWYNVERNITHDLDAVFGAKTWNMTRVQVYAYATGGGEISVIYDDMDFVDAIPPEILWVNTVTSPALYYEAVQIATAATDNLAGVREVSIHASSNGGSIWDEYSTIEVGPGLYEGWIPAHDYGITMLYYIEAIDWCGQTEIDDNGGVYYSYFIDDNIAPIINLSLPEAAAIVSDSVHFLADAEDVGSGIHYVEFYVGTSLINTDYSEPYEYFWNSRSVGNGSHTVTAIAYDGASMQQSDSVIIDVQNDIAPPVLSTVLINPSHPVYDEPVSVTVAVTDISGVDNVTLFYRFGTLPIQEVVMTRSGALYIGQIPAADWDTTVQYWVVAYDTYGIASSMSPLSYVVDDIQLPTLSVLGPPTTQALTDFIQFTITGSDEGSGLAEIVMSVDGVEVFTSTISPAVVNWSSATVENGLHTLTFEVSDGAGNTASVELEYLVDNPVGFGVISHVLNSLLRDYGFVIGASTIIILFAVIKIVQHKRHQS
ncbi:MAG: hypothetical protein JW779_10600 [Candidatus Thorarchaeota archaeon]|nr:hypothetical protein [Candidatus Thorarchaeota archaeon]